MKSETANKRYATKYAHMSDFRRWMEECDYSKPSIKRYIRGASEYAASGYAYDRSTVKKWRSELIANGETNGKATEMAIGANLYVDYKNGKKRTPKAGPKPRKFTCNEDCFNCIYDDCKKPQ